MNSIAWFLIACYTKLRLLSRQKHNRSCGFGNTSSHNNNYGVLVRLRPIASYTSCTARYFSRALMELRRTLTLSQKLWIRSDTLINIKIVNLITVLASSHHETNNLHAILTLGNQRHLTATFVFNSYCSYR